jgi:hypothetical protein
MNTSQTLGLKVQARPVKWSPGSTVSKSRKSSIARGNPPQSSVGNSIIVYHLCSSILPRIPKKRGDQLEYRRGCIEGWGLHIVEGFSWDRVGILAPRWVLLHCIVYISLRATDPETAGSMTAKFAAILGLAIIVLQLV